MASRFYVKRLALVMAVLTALCGCTATRKQVSTVTPNSILDQVEQSVEENIAGAMDDTDDIRTVLHASDGADNPSILERAIAESPAETNLEHDEALPPMAAESQLESLPIDLPTALRLAGANHLQIALAAERIQESAARLDQAKILWVPSVNLGVGYNRHDGQIQDTQGEILNVSRQSLYAGGGPAVGSAPLSGGASGPARLFVELSLSEIYFQPLVARQSLRVTESASSATFNDSLLQVGVTYQELVRAAMQVEIATEAATHAQELARLTENYARAGTGLEADAQRARAEFEQRKREQSVANERVRVVSAELSRLLRLEPNVLLVAAESQPLPLNLLPNDIPVEVLIGQGLTQRPELAQYQARVAETLEQIRQEEWRPWLPHLFVGYAGAGFGGGVNGEFSNFGGRGDFDALAVWEWKNLGLGNRALQRERESQHRQAHLQYEWLRDQVIAEVSQAHSRTTYRRQQIEFAGRQVAAASDALPLNFRGIKDGQLRAIEAQQAIVALAAARNLYLASVIDYNQSQLELLRVIGEPPNEGLLSVVPIMVPNEDPAPLRIPSGESEHEK